MTRRAAFPLSQISATFPEFVIVASGGISSAEDVVEFMLAGASGAQVGTATFIHPTAMTRVIDGLIAYCERHGVERLAELIGAIEYPVMDPVLLAPIGS